MIVVKTKMMMLALASVAIVPNTACRKSKIQKLTPQSVESTRDKTTPTLTQDVITANAISHSKVVLTWTKANDETSAQKNLYYKIVGSTADNVNTIDEADNITVPLADGRLIGLDWTKDIGTGTVSDLAFRATYYFNVLVADEAGNKKIYSRAKITLPGWKHEAYLKAPNTSNSDGYGMAIAMSMDTVAVGAQLEGSTTTAIINGANLSATNDAGSNNGAVYVFKRSDTTWTHEAYLKAPNSTNADIFGQTVAISGDTIAVGATGEDSTTTAIINGSDLSATNNSGNANGAVYIFKRSGTTWTHEAYLKAPNNTNTDEYGVSVGIFGDTVAVGASQEDSNTTAIINGADLSSTNNAGGGNGAVYVYKRNGSTWTHEAYLKAPNNTNVDQFGISVAISGETIAVGADLEDSNTTSIVNGADLGSTNNAGSANGAVYVFKRSGSAWAHEAYLKAPNTTNSDQFGWPVSISGDTIAVGAYMEDSTTTAIINGADLSSTNNSGTNVGAVYVFKRSGTTWTHEAYLKAPSTPNSDSLGYALAISGDTVAVGARLEDSNTTSIVNGADLSTINDSGTDNGAVYVFKRSGSTWTHEAYLKAPNTTDLDVFGTSVAIWDDTVAVGATGEDSNTTAIIHGSDLSATNNSGSDNGAVYIFR